MKKLLTCVATLMFLLGLASPQKACAQGGVIDVLGSGIDDADKLMNAYFRPFGESFSIGLGQNWFNTAAPLKPLRFNVQLGASLVRVPSENQLFNPIDLNLTNLRALGNEAPTLMGQTGNGPSYELSVADPANPNQRMVIDTLDGLTRGFGLTAMLAPFAQFNIGLIKGTELSVRYVPTLDLGTVGNDLSGSFGLWGVGVKHDIKQWIPGVKKLPFSLSGYFNYTKLNFDLGVSLAGPESNSYGTYSAPGDVVGFDYVSGSSAADYSSQAITMDASSMGFGIIASKKILMFTPYASLGFQNARFSLKTAGDYAILSGLAVDNNNPAQPGALREQYTVFTDPINISPDAISSLRYSAGLRFRFLIFGVHAEYFGLGDFNGFNFGLSLGF
jgi:hypothetical protein